MSYPFATRVQNLTSSAVRDLLGVIQNEDVISFAGGLPDEGLFPSYELEQAYEKVFRSGGKSLQYGPTEGDSQLRMLIQDVLKEKGIHTAHENILITTGSQQAIDLFAKVFISPGDTVLIENPAYLAALQSFHLYEANVIPVQSDSNGMLPDDLEQKIIAFHPKFIYVVPTFSNPQGKLWSKERREALLHLAETYNVLIFEDDPYSALRYTEEEQLSLAAMDGAEKHVVYTSTFSKTVAPGIRTGWITGPGEIIRTMVLAKQAADLHSSSIDQQALYYLLQDFPLQQHLSKIRKEYHGRLHSMQQLLSGVDQDLFHWEEPKGGMFLWVSINRPIDTVQLLKEAVANGVAFVPGAPFFVGKRETNTLRLNYTHSTEEVIKIGMGRLMSAIDTMLESKANVR